MANEVWPRIDRAAHGTTPKGQTDGKPKGQTDGNTNSI
ncbi:hypothetical protein COO91_00841 [Nostoc flagelliforme CCNUN1]|uniref:Uncharacterized protein n=2 Tax=Nostoc flagelliforme TaxID=1306274 RepID=A0A2K8SI95_9NOSO|nr:hypothetical protein COO91_00841 [Nostoc flagelliforme CCNUN1]